MVRSGRRTLRPRSRSPEKAWGEVTSWTRWRSMKRRVGALSRAWTTWESQSFSMMVCGIWSRSKSASSKMQVQRRRPGGLRYGAALGLRYSYTKGRPGGLPHISADGFAYLFGGGGLVFGAEVRGYTAAGQDG